MTANELAAGLAGLGVVAAAAYAWSQRGGDDGPIRVKGGSLTIEGRSDWEQGGGHYKPRRDNPRLKFFAFTLSFEGVAGQQLNGREVEIDVMEPGSGSSQARKIVIKVAGGVRIKPDRLRAHGKVLEHEDTGAYMQYIRVKGGVSTSEFGPFDAAQSHNLLIEIRPQE